MLILVSKEDLLEVLNTELKCWKAVSPHGPNYEAFDFNPAETDPKLLRDLGYYEDRESWIAGIRCNALNVYIKQIEESPQHKPKR